VEHDSRNDFLTTDDLFVSRPLSLGEWLQQFEAGAFVTATDPTFQVATGEGRTPCWQGVGTPASQLGRATVDRDLRVLDLRPDRLKWRAC
jgi:hypothetical protein